MDDVSKLLRAAIIGLIVGIVVAFILFVISALLPGIQINASFWGFVIGVIAGLYVFFNENTLRRG